MRLHGMEGFWIKSMRLPWGQTYYETLRRGLDGFGFLRKRSGNMRLAAGRTGEIGSGLAAVMTSMPSHGTTGNTATTQSPSVPRLQISSAYKTCQGMSGSGARMCLLETSSRFREMEVPSPAREMTELCVADAFIIGRFTARSPSAMSYHMTITTAVWVFAWFSRWIPK